MKINMENNKLKIFSALKKVIQVMYLNLKILGPIPPNILTSTTFYQTHVPLKDVDDAFMELLKNDIIKIKNNKVHLQSIPKNLSRKLPKYKGITVEDILQNNQKQDVQNLVSQFTQIVGETYALNFVEKFIWTIENNLEFQKASKKEEIFITTTKGLKSRFFEIKKAPEISEA